MLLGVSFFRLARSGVALATTLAFLAASAPAIGSPADKATARELATEGIALYNEGDCKGALDRLERAEQLYSAPVHLLYIARCQAKLDQLIEAAETYRVIKRMKLSTDAPEQFEAAVKDADRELGVVTDEIPRLILQVSPQPEGVAITINGEDVPPAVIGVERLTNPGERVIRVTAPGFEPATATIKLKRSEVRELEIPLTPTGGVAPVVPSEDGKAPPAPAKPESKPGPNGIIWFVGARLGLILPAGNLLKEPLADGNIPMSAVASTGGGGEILGGLTFARYFTPFAFVTGYALKAENDTDRRLGIGKGNGGVMLGAGMRFGSPRRQFGGFGEVAFARNVLAMNRTFVGAACTVTASANSVRLGGGLAIPISDLFELTPELGFTFGKFSRFDVPNTASCLIPRTALPEDIPTEDQSAYLMFQIGLGGEFLFGGTE
jgi:hypothetical protein